MSIEQIAAIKAKRLAKKRGTIKTDDIDGAGVSVEIVYLTSHRRSTITILLPV